MTEEQRQAIEQIGKEVREAGDRISAVWVRFAKRLQEVRRDL